mgnify:CR=1 FL=1
MIARVVRRCCSLVIAFLCISSPRWPPRNFVGLQSAPSIAMAVPWFAEVARLYPKYDLDFQLVYIASSGIVTAAMSGGNGSVAIVGGEGPIRAFLSGNTDFVFIGSVKNVLTHSIMGKGDIRRPEDLRGKRIGVGRIGGNSHYFTQLAMRQKGLDPLKDANLIQTGGAPETLWRLRRAPSTRLDNDAAGHARGVSGLQLRHRRPVRSSRRTSPPGLLRCARSSLNGRR